MRRVLFVGAPFGRFFRYVAPALEAKGVTVWRTVSDGGELVATPVHNALYCRGDQAEWSDFLIAAMREKRITSLVTFNDSCWRSRAAHDIAARLGIKRYVLEEGYLRPFWVTFDREGVNGNSLLPKDPDFYLAENRLPVPYEQFRQSFRFLVRDTILHYAACTLLSPFIPFDPSYYGDSVWRQSVGYTREYVWRKTHSEAGILAKLREQAAAGRKIFVALLQKPGDAQLRFHSDFKSNNPYMREVIASFAAHADRDALLVVKQHPLDYGIEGSPRLFEQLIDQHGLRGRAVYVRKLTIESVLEITSGVVTINSTGGLAAIERLVPTLAMGKAIYAMPRITHQDGIDTFWTAGAPPDAEVVAAFLGYLRSRTQINGGFYSRSSLCLLADNLSKAMTEGLQAPHHALAGTRPRAQDVGLEPIVHRPLQV